MVSEIIFKVERRARWNFDVPCSSISDMAAVQIRYDIKVQKPLSPVNISLPFWELLQHMITSR